MRAVGCSTPIAAALDAAHATRPRAPRRQARRTSCSTTTAAYLADFGLTKAADGGRVTESSHFARHRRLRGPRADQAASRRRRRRRLRARLRPDECLIGRPPFRAGSPMSVMFSHLDGEVPSASKNNRALPAAVDGVLTRALAKEPDERYATAGELVEAAKEALGLSRPTPSHRGNSSSSSASASPSWLWPASRDRARPRRELIHGHRTRLADPDRRGDRGDLETDRRRSRPQIGRPRWGGSLDLGVGRFVALESRSADRHDPPGDRTHRADGGGRRRWDKPDERVRRELPGCGQVDPP